MGRFIQGNLSDMDVMTCWLASQTGDGSFEMLVAKRKEQKRLEIVQLEEDVAKLISKPDFERMVRIFLTSKSENCTMKQSEEIITKLDEERTAKPRGAYAKIAESLRTPSYGNPNDKKVEKLSDDESVEWVHAGTVKLEQLKRKYKKGGE